jgi:uncharacterized membrane protein
MLGMEFWLFEIVTVIIAHMGSIVVGTNQILMTLTRWVMRDCPLLLLGRALRSPLLCWFLQLLCV